MENASSVLGRMYAALLLRLGIGGRSLLWLAIGCVRVVDERREDDWEPRRAWAVELWRLVVFREEAEREAVGTVD